MISDDVVLFRFFSIFSGVGRKLYINKVFSMKQTALNPTENDYDASQFFSCNKQISPPLKHKLSLTLF